MLWFLIGHIFSTLISLIRISRLSENDKDLEIIILRHQLDVMVRKQNQPVKPNRAEKATLALLTAQLKKNTNRTIRQLGDVIRIVRPETVIRWHRQLVRRKWTQQQKKQVGRPKINREKESLIVRLAKENLRWGYYRIEGELKKLGFDAVFQSRQISVIHTPLEAPNANAFAERWVRSVRQELLDHVLVLNQAHLRRVLQTYIDHYNSRRPHQSLAPTVPDSLSRDHEHWHH